MNTSQIPDFQGLFVAQQTSPLILICLVLVTALVPIALMATTCMLKLSVVFMILRSALGAGQIPSAPIATLLSIVLTWYIMSPVANSVFQKLEVSRQQNPSIQFEELATILDPLSRFMKKHTGEREQKFFSELSSKQESMMPVQLAEIIPAFVVSQLREALLIGCAIFVPFLVIDLVVANILVGLGMVMVSPMQIALPLKLLLFTVCDGWLLLTRSLILSYQ